MFMKDNDFEQIEQVNLLNQPKPTINISVLRHLSKPLEILQKDESYLNFADPVCCYPTELHSLPQRILPTQQNTQKKQVQATRLISMQNAQTEFQQVKRMFQRSRLRTTDHNINENEQEQRNHLPKTKTLYNMFCLKPPYYCRFENHNVTKNNFANVFVNVAGVNLQTKAINNGKKSSGATRRIAKLTDRQKLYNTGSLIFDSSFESGNLLYAYEKHSQNEGGDLPTYQLILQNDTNTYGHNQWFFFRVQSLKPHSTVKFCILNLIKSDSLFNYGLKPLVYSQKDNFSKSIGWLRRGENVKYFQNDIRRENKKENYFTLEFQYTFKETKDWVYFCPSYPYTYTQMTGEIENFYASPQYKKCFSIKTICQTLGKNKVNLITISTGQKSIDQCKVVWVLARQHPTETTGSFMVEGMLRYLLPLISEAKTSQKSTSLAQLNDYVFKIVPMVNVDGVIHGNSRAQLIGLDPNRLWKKPRKTISPTIYSVLKEILTYKSKISMVLDLHSHSKKTGCFFYGNEMGSNSKLPKIYPTLVCENDERFTLKNCRFHGGYKTTARHILFKQLSNCQNIFTVECSLLGYLNNKTNRVTQYTIQDFHEMGAKLIENFFKLENIKLEKDVNQIIEEFNEKIDHILEVDSAKSESGVSDDQYEEIKQLQRKIMVKKKKNQCDKKSVNKSLITNLVRQQISKDQNNTKRRACSFSKHRTRTVLTKIQQNSTTIIATTDKLIHSSKPQKSVKYLRDESQSAIKIRSENQILKNITSNCQSPSMNTIGSLKQTYMKYLSNPKIYNESKGKTEETLKVQNKKLKTDEVAVQVMLEKRKNITTESKVLQNSISAVNSINDSVMRPLLVLGNTCQAQYTLFNKNEISIQVNSENDAIKKQQKALAKLPKLMTLISSSKQKMKRYSNYAAKENQSGLTTTIPARYTDPKTLLCDDMQKKSLIYNNIKPRHA